MNKEALPPELTTSLEQLAEEYSEIDESGQREPQSYERLAKLLFDVLEHLE